MTQPLILSVVSLLELREQVAKCSLAALDDRELQRLAAASERRGFVMRGSVWDQPGMQSTVLLVVQGRFRIQWRSKDPDRQILCGFGRPGDLIGSSRIVGDQQPPDVFADVRRAPHERPKAIVMPSALLSELFDESRAFARALLREAQAAADDLAEDVVGLRCDTFVERALARIGRALGRNSGELDWSRGDLARLVGGTRFDVSRELGRLAPFLEWQGKRGKLIVRDLAEARRLIAYRKELASDPELSMALDSKTGVLNQSALRESSASCCAARDERAELQHSSTAPARDEGSFSRHPPFPAL